MSGIGRRLAQLEEAANPKRARYVWLPEDLAPEGQAAWLRELREREGWADDDSVVIFSWEDRCVL